MPMMKSAFARVGGGIDSITFQHVPMPTPGPGEALVQLKAAALNFRDLLILRGVLGKAKEPSYVPLSDATGEVIAVGDGVSRVAIGDRVNPLFAQGWFTGTRPTGLMLGGPADGVARQYATFDAANLCRIPDQIGDPEAATLPCAGLTAWNALFGPRPLQAGEWVLVQGTGGVSLAALQWAKAAGAKVILTSSSDAKLQRGAALGADITINYRSTPDWASAARDALGGRGVDIVVDVVGAAQIEGCASAVADDGIIAAVGQLQGEASWGKQVSRSVIPIAIGNREQHEAMLTFCAARAIKPVIDATFGLPELPAALRLLESGAFFGKIAINMH
jgi:NADPH:quinone reductase-like Zn-dependent oxidoreductase